MRAPASLKTFRPPSYAIGKFRQTFRITQPALGDKLDPTHLLNLLPPRLLHRHPYVPLSLPSQTLKLPMQPQRRRNVVPRTRSYLRVAINWYQLGESRPRKHERKERLQLTPHRIAVLLLSRSQRFTRARNEREETQIDCGLGRETVPASESRRKSRQSRGAR